MVTRSAARWRSAPRHALAWREWEGELVVRHAGTGDTHLLSTVGTRLLLTLLHSERGLAPSELVQALPPDDTDELVRIAIVEATLAEFQYLGLAAPEWS